MIVAGKGIKERKGMAGHERWSPASQIKEAKVK
jgi:hypothetical protein